MATSEIFLPLLGGVRDYSAAPGIAWINTRCCLLFDGTTDELIAWQFRMPNDYSSGLTVKWQYSMVSATTNKVAIRAQMMAASDGDNIDTNSYDTLEASSDSTVPVTAGLMKEISFALTNVDGLVAGDYVSIHLGRENGTTGILPGGGTNASGDMEVWAISLTYTTT